ncbi:MAG TPA: hypothetical protein VFV57_00510 [Limnobacter sp.]|nr:hypothetical protein [Limnobacter sp.]
MTPSNSISTHGNLSGNPAAQGASLALATFRANLALLNQRPLQMKSGTLPPGPTQSKVAQITSDTASLAVTAIRS